ncbi:MAG TPA: hypothetical protein VGN12_22910 [Pirellulales bacterium]|jgi:hypothetical protein
MNLDVFLARVVQGCLMKADAFERTAGDFLAGARAPNWSGSDLYAFGDLLVYRGELTRWQFDAILNGFTDFHFANFKLLEPLANQNATNKYLAEDTNSGRRVALTFGKQPSDDVGTLFEVTPIDGGQPVHVDMEISSALRWRGTQAFRSISYR